jgi:transcriptional regulator with XRE-family HTH domain
LGHRDAGGGTVSQESYRTLLPKSVGLMLRRARLARGWSLRATAHRIGVSPGYLCNVERGRRAPRTKTAIKIADVLRLAPEERAILLRHAAPVTPSIGHV